jgi:hypothetical protein
MISACDDSGPMLSSVVSAVKRSRGAQKARGGITMPKQDIEIMTLFSTSEVTVPSKIPSQNFDYWVRFLCQRSIRFHGTESWI